MTPMDDLTQRLRRAFETFSTRPAIAELRVGSDPQAATYAELAQLAEHVAAALAERRFAAGEQAVLYMRRSVPQVAAMVAAIRSGGVFCPVDARAPAGYLLSVLERAHPRVLFVDADTRLALEQAGFEPDASLSVFELGWREALEPPPAPPWVERLRLEAWNGRRPDLAADEEVGPSDPVCCLFTSGSTGVPKGVLIARGDLLERAATEASDYELTESDVLLGLLPFSFDVGLNQLLSSLLSGAELVLSHSWFPIDLVAACEGFGVTGISAVPAVWIDCLRMEGRDDLVAKTRTLRYLTVSAGSLGLEELRRLRRLFPHAGVFRTYGQTETFRSTILRPHEFDAKMASVGRPVRGTHVLVVNERGQPAAPDEEGEILHGGAGTMLRYLDDRRDTAAKLRSHPFPDVYPGTPGPMVYTGDIGRIDADGYLYVLGRRDRMVKISGYRVYPAEVEHALRSHPDVRAAAVFAEPDDGGAPRLIAAVQTAPDATNGPGDLRAFLASRLPHYMVPARITFHARLPMTVTGKIDYRSLESELGLRVP
jgi:acyl-coenzyme A synthetase/AMP-(fatty) acid ligase